jgi:succinate dehydrogenase / fumarate reductase cytochrome b subunit
MSKSGLFKSSIGRKLAMALSALFLMIFLLQHLVINITAIISPDTFNELSHFMGTNPLVQFVAQPILIFAVVFHFIMGFVLEIKNRAARPISYNKFNGAANSTWMSRNMIISGLVILAFLALHFVDFWFPEINTKYIVGDMSGMHDGEFRYYEELLHKFANPVRVGVYVLAFILLALHLMHGFGSAFQSMGQNNKYIDGLKKFGVIYSVAVPLGFILIAISLYVTTLN